MEQLGYIYILGLGFILGGWVMTNIMEKKLTKKNTRRTKR